MLNANFNPRILSKYLCGLVSVHFNAKICNREVYFTKSYHAAISKAKNNNATPSEDSSGVELGKAFFSPDGVLLTCLDKSKVFHHIEGLATTKEECNTQDTLNVLIIDEMAVVNQVQDQR